MTLIPDWRTSYRLYSVQLTVLIALLNFAQLTILPMWEAQLSPLEFASANSVLATLLFIARLVRQEPAEPPEQLVRRGQ